MSCNCLEKMFCGLQNKKVDLKKCGRQPSEKLYFSGLQYPWNNQKKKSTHCWEGIELWNFTHQGKPNRFKTARYLLLPATVLWTVWTKGKILISEVVPYKKICSSTCKIQNERIKIIKKWMDEWVEISCKNIIFVIIVFLKRLA